MTGRAARGLPGSILAGIESPPSPLYPSVCVFFLCLFSVFISFARFPSFSLPISVCLYLSACISLSISLSSSVFFCLSVYLFLTQFLSLLSLSLFITIIIILFLPFLHHLSNFFYILFIHLAIYF